jgi:hypothetical protein
LFSFIRLIGFVLTRSVLVYVISSYVIFDCLVLYYTIFASYPVGLFTYSEIVPGFLIGLFYLDPYRSRQY